MTVYNVYDVKENKIHLKFLFQNPFFIVLFCIVFTPVKATINWSHIHLLVVEQTADADDPPPPRAISSPIVVFKTHTLTTQFHWLMLSVSVMSMSTVVYFESIPHTLSRCQKYSPENQMSVHPHAEKQSSINASFTSARLFFFRMSELCCFWKQRTE